jgi:RNA-directed DNA polymerase
MGTALQPMYEWEAINWAKVQRKVSKLQKRIYQASERGDVQTVHKLQRLLTKSRSAKLLAVRKVTQDEQSKNLAEVNRVAKLRNQQKVKLAARLRLNDKSQPTTRVWLKKPRKEEKSSLGIPTLEERAKQTLLKTAMEPEWEAKFKPNSYGFKSGRSVHDAIAAIYNGIVHKPQYVLVAEIETCFDQINHSRLLAQLQTTPTFRRQIRAWLQSGVMDSQELFLSRGNSQEKVIFSLLANGVLHGLAKLLETKDSSTTKHGKKQKVTFVRYGTNLVLMNESLEAIQEANELVKAWLQEMGFTLKEAKTTITHTFHEHEGEIGFNFLGFHIRQYSCSNRQSEVVRETKIKRGHKTFIQPSKEAIKQYTNQIDSLLRRHKTSSQKQLIKAINPVIQEWTAYYSTVASKSICQKLDNILFHKLFAWAKRRRSRGQSKTDVVSSYWGVNRGLGWQFMTPNGQYVLKKNQLSSHLRTPGTVTG